jgi:hypothetical protein
VADALQVDLLGFGPVIGAIVGAAFFVIGWRQHQQPQAERLEPCPSQRDRQILNFDCGQTLDPAFRPQGWCKTARTSIPLKLSRVRLLAGRRHLVPCWEDA